MSNSPLPNINADPNKAPVKVQVDWLCKTGEVAIDATPRTVALLRGRFGEIELRSLRIQFPQDPPPNFEAWTAVYQVPGYATKRGIVVARLEGKRRATCYVDLPAPISELMQAPALVNVNRAPNDYYHWAGVRTELRATPHLALAVVVWSNQATVCEAFLGGM